jgi:hypothetical protein
MKNRMVKRILMAALTGTICLGCTVAAYAGTGNGRGGQPMVQSEDGERPKPPEGDMNDGERPEPPEGDMNNGERPEPPEGDMNNGERPKPPQGERMELPEGAVNIGAYKASLDSIEDNDTKASLQEYLDALEEAINAEREALDSGEDLTDEEMSAYRDTVSEAQDALVAAFEEAGIEVSDDMPEITDRDELPEGVAGNKPENAKNNDNGQSMTKRTAPDHNAEASSDEADENTDARTTDGSKKKRLIHKRTFKSI